MQYNHKKFTASDPSLKKDATTYCKERKRILNENKIPKEESQKCPFHKKDKKIRRKLLC
jgi:hypothetical protein